jgi:dipeptidase
MYKALLILLTLIVNATLSCTTIAVGKHASSDGSVIVTQSDDGDGQVDARIIAIPAQTFPNKTARREIFPNALIGYPRYVGNDRGDIPPYATNPFDPIPQKSTGSIKQVASTYAYWEGDYGLLNSVGVGIGETSCSARILAPEGSALLPIEELSRIALERTNSSRSAVLLIGSLAEKHGFYGVLSGDNLNVVPNEGGESLMIGDKNEAWVLHILSDGKGGAIWAAQRVDDRKVAVVSNMFTIRDVNLNDTNGEQFLWSSSMTIIAAERGWWKDGQPFDFTRMYSYGEYYAFGYSSKRMWRAFDLLAPSLHLNMTLAQRPLFLYPQYPFEVVPDVPVIPQHLMTIHRDYYQNTSIDMSQGPAAGPWNLPVRFNPEQAYNGDVRGNWHRPIGSFRTGYTAIVELKQNSDSNVVHFAPHTMLGSTFVPVFGKALGGPQGDFKTPYQAIGLDVADPRANNKGIDRTSLYWACRFAINVAYSRFRNMHPYIVEQQRIMEDKAAALVRHGAAVTPMDAYQMTTNHTQEALIRWWNVSDQMIIHWSDGFFNEYFTAVDTEYPKWWLEVAEYQNGPPDPILNTV